MGWVDSIECFHVKLLCLHGSALLYLGHSSVTCRYLHVSASCGLPWHANRATTMAQRAFALPLVAADQPPFSWAGCKITPYDERPFSSRFHGILNRRVYAHPLHPLAAAHWSSSRAPLADPAPQSRILQRGAMLSCAVLCCAMLCCQVLNVWSGAINQAGSIKSNAKRRPLQASSPLVAHPFSADSPLGHHH